LVDLRPVLAAPSPNPSPQGGGEPDCTIAYWAAMGAAPSRIL